MKNGWQNLSVENEYQYIERMINMQRNINFRPIAVLPCVDKVWKVLLGQQVSDTTLIRLTETWKTELDREKVVGVL